MEDPRRYKTHRFCHSTPETEADEERKYNGDTLAYEYYLFRLFAATELSHIGGYVTLCSVKRTQ